MKIKAMLEEGAGSEQVSRLFSIERYAWMALSYDMALAMDMDGCIQVANSAWQRASGHLPEVLRGQYLLEFMEFDDRERVLASFQHLITSDAATSTFAFRFLCADGEFKRFSWNVLYSPDHEVFFCIVKDISDVNDLHHAAYHDTLTGLPNRLFLTDTLPMLLEAAKQHRKSLAFLLLDLDGFKRVNDTLGHQAGDILLQTMAERLRQCVSKPENCVRLGGDEFVLFEMPCDSQKAQNLATAIITAVNQPEDIDGNRVQVGASIGISMAPDDATTLKSLMRLADLAMYEAKREGKNRFVFSDSTKAHC